MNSKWEAFRGSAGFYVTMAVCLLVIGVSGYFLLVDQDKPAQTEIQPNAESQQASAPAEIRVPENSAPVMTLTPEPIQEEPEPMPEVEIDDTPVMAEAPRLIVSPLKGEVVTAFSMDELLYNPTLEDWRTHDGVDISAKPGATVLAASSGTVLAVEDDALMGTTVVIEHDGGYQTTYANLQSKPTVEIGDTVSAGQIIGAVGNTAAAEAAQSPHLHFSVTRDGEAVDPDEFLKS